MLFTNVVKPATSQYTNILGLNAANNAYSIYKGRLTNSNNKLLQSSNPNRNINNNIKNSENFCICNINNNKIQTNSIMNPNLATNSSTNALNSIGNTNINNNNINNGNSNNINSDLFKRDLENQDEIMKLSNVINPYYNHNPCHL